MTRLKLISIVTIFILFLSWIFFDFLFNLKLYSFCFGKDAVWSESTCALVKNGTLITIFFTLTLALLLSIAFHIVRSFKKSPFAKRFFAFTGLVALVANIFGLLPISYCLGFLGCSIFYLWPNILPFTLYFYSCFFTFLVFYDVRPLKNWTWSYMGKLSLIFVGISLLLMVVIGSLSNLVREKQVVILDFVTNVIQDEVETQYDPVMLLPDSDHGTVKNYSISNHQGTYLSVSSADVFVFVRDKNNQIVLPKNLYAVEEDSLHNTWFTDTRDYYIDNGVTYVKLLSSKPFSYQLSASSSGTVDLNFIAGNTNIFTQKSVPIYTGTQMTIPVYQDENGKINIDKVKYDLEGDGYIEQEISWNESACVPSLRIIKKYLDSLDSNFAEAVLLNNVMSALSTGKKDLDEINAHMNMLLKNERIDGVIIKQLQELYFVCVQ